MVSHIPCHYAQIRSHRTSVKEQLQALFHTCAVTHRPKKAVRNDMEYGILLCVWNCSVDIVYETEGGGRRSVHRHVAQISLRAEGDVSGGQALGVLPTHQRWGTTRP